MSTQIELVKDYWDKNPCNIRHSKAEIGTQEYFDQVEFRKYKVEPHIPRFADFPRWRGKRVLEIGFGIGTDAVNFARHGADYTGIDISQASFNVAYQRFELFGLKGKLIVGDAEHLYDWVGSEQKFDLIYSFGVLHHTPCPEAVVDYVRHNLSESGEFRFMVYAQNSWKAAMIEAGLDQPESRGGCPIADTYSHGEVEALLIDFKSITMEQAHIFPYDVEKYIAHEYVLTPWFRDMPRQMFDALESKFGWHLLVTAK